jgi:lysyl-tRNA synthetase class 2
VVRLWDVDNTGASSELAQMHEAVAEQTRRQISRPELTSLPEITSWRRAYSAFGAKTTKYKPTLEAMLLRLLQGKPFPSISKLVDAYLIVQTQHLLPIGGYDRSRLRGDIRLRRSPGDELFTPLGADQPELTREHELVYADQARILTRNWNYRDSEETKIDMQSTDVLLCMEAVAEEVPTSRVEAAVEDLARLALQFCGGRAAGVVCDVAAGDRRITAR